MPDSVYESTGVGHQNIIEWILKMPEITFNLSFEDVFYLKIVFVMRLFVFKSFAYLLEPINLNKSKTSKGKVS